MPDNSHPPYSATAIQYPRQLNRWLDINAQGGSLRRTQAYVALPAFSIGFSWRGYSDIVASFNFEGPNNFSFLLLEGTIPLNKNYTLCVQYIDYKGVVYRYSLWRAENDEIFFELPEYTGQLIGKNFRLEVWSTPNTPALNTNSLQLYTSVLGTQDYRHGVDFILVNSDPICTTFSYSGTQPILLPLDIGILADWNPFYGINYSLSGYSWSDLISGSVLDGSPNNTITVIASSTPSLARCISIPDSTQYLSGVTPQFGVNVLILVAEITSNSGALPSIFAAYPGGLTLEWNNGVAGSGGAIGSGLAQNTWYTFLVWVDGVNVYINVYSLQTSVLITSGSAVQPSLQYSLQATIGNAGMNVLEAIMGSGTIQGTDGAQIATYMTNRYWGGISVNFALPFEFPANSVVTPNMPVNNWLKFQQQAPPGD